MALEQMFKCPRTLKRLRNDPLGMLLEGFCNWLLQQGFSRGAIRKHLISLSHLNEYLGGARSQPLQGINPREVDGFFKAYPLQRRNRRATRQSLRRMRYSVNRFLQYLRESGHLDSLRCSEIYELLLDAYLQWMRQYQHASEGTIELRSHSITQLLQWLGPEATPEGLLNLTAERIEKFFLRYAQTMGRSARRSMQSALRSFLRFCLHQGYIQRPLDLAVPTLRTYKLATVPRGLSDTEAQQVLRSISRKSLAGRRDYAIVQLLYTYGVRGGQLRALRLEDIDWVKNQILFKASKHGKDSRLPLTDEVGESLLDYLQHARPSCPYPHVFLTCRAPYHPLTHSSSLSAIVERHLRTAGIEFSCKGAHVFRHYAEFRTMPSSFGGTPIHQAIDALRTRHNLDSSGSTEMAALRNGGPCPARVKPRLNLLRRPYAEALQPFHTILS